jgi:predicted transcriptional regulator
MRKQKPVLPKVLTSVRISPEAKRLMAELSRFLSISQSSVLEIAIREKAQREGLKQL